jgi:hypothetical protein
MGVDEAKRRVIASLGEGDSVANAMTKVGRTVKTYESWRYNDKEFAANVDRVRNGFADRPAATGEFPSFAEFSDKYLGAQVFPHMQNVVDLMEGRDPAWVHPSMTWEKNEPDLVICNMPPEHSKSTTLTVNYLTYRICKDPNVRIIIVSKTQAMAAKFLYGIKTRLTHPQYGKLQMDFAPQGGFSAGSESWSQSMIYVSQDARTGGEKDPTVLSLGVRGHIYGSRADIIILDDIVDGTNAHEYEKQIEWIQSEVISRIASSGMLVVVGTRLSSQDLYSELRKPERYPDEVSPWSYLSMPAVLEYADTPNEWVTLWPKSNIVEPGAKGDAAEPDEQGLYPKWDGPRLAKKRARIQPRTWAMVYQQEQINTDAIFTPQMLAAAVNGARFAGPMPKNHNAVRNGKGGDGLIYVMGVDPATSGHTAAVVMGLDVQTQQRYVIDVFNKPGITPDQMRDMITGYIDTYGLAEVRIEKNGFQGFLVHDTELNNYAASRGTIIQPHFTGHNKHDTDFGVASMTSLFAGWEDKKCLIEFPSSMNSEAMKALMEQFVTWAPDMSKKQKQDIVMAAWFAELACRDRVVRITGSSHRKNPYLVPWDYRQRRTISLLDAEASSLWRPVGAA